MVTWRGGALSRACGQEALHCRSVLVCKRHRGPSCSHCLRQLDLPYEAVHRQCRKLLDESLEADAGFLNFCLDALVVSIIGTRSRDFQLDLCDESVAIMDPDLLVLPSLGRTLPRTLGKPYSWCRGGWGRS